MTKKVSFTIQDDGKGNKIKVEQKKKKKSVQPLIDAHFLVASPALAGSPGLGTSPNMKSQEVGKFPDFPTSGEAECSTPPTNNVCEFRVIHFRFKSSILKLVDGFSVMKNLFSDCPFIIAVEKPETPEQHFHVAIRVSTNLDSIEKHRPSFFSALSMLKVQQKEDGTYGNGKYSLAWENHTGRTEIYCVKDHEFLSHLHTEEYISTIQLLSFKKFTKEEFAKKLDLIIQHYMENKNTEINTFILQFIHLKLDYNQSINFKTIQNYCTLIYYKKNRDEVQCIANLIAQQITQPQLYGSYREFIPGQR